MTSLRLDMSDHAFRADPFPLYRLLRDRAPVHRDPDGFWLVSRYDDVVAVLGDWESFSSAPPAGNPMVAAIGEGDLLNLDPPRHGETRGLIKAHFSPRAVAPLAPLVRSRARGLLESLRVRGGGDLAAEFAWPLPVMTILHVLGLPEGDAARVTSWVRSLDGPDEGAVIAVLTAVRAYADAAIRRADAPACSVLADVAAARAAGALTGEEAGGLVTGLILAGTGTVACLLSNAPLVLQRHAEQRALLQSGQVEIAPAVEELLRFESPVQLLPRTAARDVELHGELIPAGAEILLALGSANRDERRFEAADALDLRRRPSRHLALGSGIHFCIGGALARLEARVGLEELFACAPDYELAGEPVRIPSAEVRGLHELPVILR